MKILSTLLFDVCFQVKPLKWQRVLEDSRIMISICQKMLLMLQDKLNKENCIAIYLFVRRVLTLVRKSGLLFTCLYLKQCSSSLQTAYAGIKRQHERLPVPVSLNRSGYPRIIPPFHRKQILRKDEKADQLVQLYLSFFTLNKIIRLAKKVSYANTFKSIVEPTDLDAASIWCGELRDKLPTLVHRYLPWVSTIPLNQGMSWVPTWKSLPTHRRVNELFSEILQKYDIASRRPISIFPALLFEMNAFSFLLERIHLSEDHFSSGCLWPVYTRYALDSRSTQITNWCLTEFEKVTGPQLPTYHQLKEPPICGRLGQSVEGGGKRRIFAIGNYINQRLLKPVHDWLMEVLRRLSTDGTFYQERPLLNLIGEQHCFSFDLKSATDRWPLQIMFEVMQVLFDRSFASSVRSALALNIFEVPFVKPRKGAPSVVSFVCGQPLGYYSSWPLFALSHHFLVWWCAEQVYPGIRFDRYGILGDDVVIADREVANIYAQTLARINVGISYQKSLISDTGGAEFAKRLRIRNMTKDISPVSARAFLSFFNPYGLLAIGLKYNCQRFSTLARIGGAGYKQLAKIDTVRNKRISRLWSMQMKALLGHGQLELWLGRGRPLNPYLKWILKEKILNEMKPKDLRLTPEELYVAPKVGDFQEYSTLRGWVKQWTTYVRWYYVIAMDPATKLDELFDGPVCATDWKAGRKEETLVRFGLLWKLYDMVTQLGLDYRLPILSSGRPPEQSGCWLFGGIAGDSFLVSSFGLVQPKAGKGIVLPGVELNPSQKVDPRQTLIHYKTLGVPDRRSVLDFSRPVRPTNRLPIGEYPA
nr:MAG: putative RNA-dependent RNA polymerase [Mitoviridae sp.]